MSPSRRDFIRTIGKGAAGAAAFSMYSNELMAQIIADSPQGRALETKFKGLADIQRPSVRPSGQGGCDKWGGQGRKYQDEAPAKA